MTRTGTLAAALALTTMFACAPAPEPVPTMGTPEDEAAVQAAFRSMLAAYNSADAAAMAAGVADDYDGIDPEGTRVQGRAGFEADMSEELAAQQRPEGFEITADVGFVQWHGADHASVAGSWQAAGMPEGVADSGSFLFNYERSDTGWLQQGGLVATFQPPPAMPEME